MTHRVIGLLTLALATARPDLLAQSWRVAVWGAYETVTDTTDTPDWTGVGGQLTAVARRGDAAWFAVERLKRFGAQDEAARAGVALHPGPRWWLSVEGATAVRPVFAPKTAWEGNVTALVARGTAAGLGYRRQNYGVGVVDVAIGHLSVERPRASGETRVFVSRNTSDRTDVAAVLRVTFSLATRWAVWLGGGAGRESYIVGRPPAQQVRSLKTVTAIAGAHYTTKGGTSIRLDISVVRSQPVLSRRGVAIGVEQRF